MKYYLAPMEGITGFVFRNAYHEYFTPMDKYFAPFISPNQNICFTPREYRDICPENNKIPHVIPQILTNKAEDFIKTSQELAKMGYEEVNLNLGCPSGTVTAKRKGAGFLMETGRLREFFERIFEKPCVRISVKTRLGMYSTDEFSELLAIFNDYPLAELIVHPRVGKEFYDGVPHRDVYLGAVGESRNLLCYNGNLYCEEDVRGLLEECREIERGVRAAIRCEGTKCSVGFVTECEEIKYREGYVEKCEEAERGTGGGMEFGKTERGAEFAENFMNERMGESYLTGDENMAKAGSAVGGCTQEYCAEEGRKMPIASNGKTVAVMFGRGILRDPWLVAKCRRMEGNLNYFDAAHIREFSNRLFSDYAQYMGEHNAMFRMKELWLYLVESFADVDTNRKKLKKAQNKVEFDAVLERLRMCGTREE